MKNLILIFTAVLSLTFSPTNEKESLEKIPDVTTEFNAILSKSKTTFRGLKKKWNVDQRMILNDIKKYHKKSTLEKSISAYHTEFQSFQNIITQIRFLHGYFKEYGKGDIKNGVFKKYNKNGGKVKYNGKIYRVEQLGNINYGVALKAFGYPMEMSVCAAGIYQLKADQCFKSRTYLKYKSAIQKCFTSKKGKCFDYKGDSRMIREGYQKF